MRSIREAIPSSDSSRPGFSFVMIANPKEPSLENAFARVARAEEHLARLKAEIETALRGRKLSIGGHQTGRFEAVELLNITDDPRTKLIPILIGEIVYNLRAALDYLVFQLVYLDSGRFQKGTKFPIEDHPNGWQKYFASRKCKGKSKRRCGNLWLPLLTPAHQAKIKALQPFSHCNWTRTLRELSNPDKHRDLIVINAAAEAVISCNPSTKNFVVPPIPDYVKGQFFAVVAFEDRSPVIDTLEALTKEITTVLSGFKDDFP